MKIGIDMDGVIVDTINFISDEFTKLFRYEITPDDVAHRLGEINGADKLFKEKGEYLLCSLDPLKGAVDVINSLNSNHEIFIITARFNMHYKATVDWLEKHDISVKEVIFTEGKGKANICTKYGINLLIEDSVKNAMEVSSAGIKVILLSTDYNRLAEANGIDYCNGWDDIYHYIHLHSSQTLT